MAQQPERANLKSQIVISNRVERIERSILLIRGHKVMLDADLAVLYGVATKVLVQSVRRNPSRFPEDFMFQLTFQEFTRLRSQIVTSNRERRRGGRPGNCGPASSITTLVGRAARHRGGVGGERRPGGIRPRELGKPKNP